MGLSQCAPLPSSYTYSLSSLKRSVGQIVKVTCAESNDTGSTSISNKEESDAMTTVLKCQPNLQWNGTVPSCNIDNDDDGNSTSIVLILVWSIGGVLLFTLILLIALIIRSKNKTRTDQSRERSPQASVFTVRGANLGRDWADNPAFSRADERCAELSAGSHPDQRRSTRLPTYQEAILNSYLITGRSPHQLCRPQNTDLENNGGAVLTAADVHTEEAPAFVRVNAPPSYRSSQLQHSQFHTSNANGNGDVGRSVGNVQSCSGSVPNAMPGSINQHGEGRAGQSESVVTNQATPISRGDQSERRVEDTAGSNQSALRVSEEASVSSSRSPRRIGSQRHRPVTESMTSFRGTPTTTGGCTMVATSTTLETTTSLQPSSAPTSASLQLLQNQTPPPSSSIACTTTSSSALASRRYVEQYPSCFFEEEPPPPYTPCSALYRSPTRRSCPTTSHHRHNQQHQQQQQQPFHRDEPSRRTLHSIPPNTNPHCRGPQFSHGPTPSRHVGYVDVTNTQDFSYSNQQGTSERLQGRNTCESSNPQPIRSQNDCQTSHLTSMPASSSILTSPSTYSLSTSSSTPSTVSVSTNHPRDSGFSSRNATTTHWSSSITPSENSTLNIPRPQFSNGNSQSGNTQYPPQLMPMNDLYEIGNRAENREIRSENGNPLYVIRSSQATPSAPPPDTLPSLIHLEAPPLGTSTPINQSPAVPRRYVPPIRPVCQNDPQIVLGGYFQEPVTDRYASIDTTIVYGASDSRSLRSQQCSHHGRPRYESPRVSTVSCMSQYGHVRHTSAPLARLESEYF